MSEPRRKWKTPIGMLGGNPDLPLSVQNAQAQAQVEALRAIAEEIEKLNQYRPHWYDEESPPKPDRNADERPERKNEPETVSERERDLEALAQEEPDEGDPMGRI